MTVEEMKTKFKVTEKDMSVCGLCGEMKLFTAEHAVFNGTDQESGERICSDCHHSMTGER
jgi:hypothetical protein